MKIFNRITRKTKVIATAMVFLYLVFSFYEWSFNPGNWDMLSRIGLIFAFGWISNQEN